MTENQSNRAMEAEVNRQGGTAADRFLERLAEQLGGKANAAAVYGAPVEKGNVTVIPVAKVRWGFGGGAGRGRNPRGGGGDSGEGSGEGGGGGMIVSPLGYIEIANGHAEFRRIVDPIALLAAAPFVLAAGISLLLVLRGLRRIVRG